MSEYDELVKRLRGPAIRRQWITEAAQAIERLERDFKALFDEGVTTKTKWFQTQRELAEARAREERAIPSFKWAHDRLCVDRQLERGEQQRTADWIRLGLEALAAPAPEQEAEQEKCSFPDCGCAEARLCMFPPANVGAMAWNLPKRR